MRFAFVPVVALGASLTLVAAQSANIDPAIPPHKIDVLRPPPPTPVYVLNFPEVQAVGGTVSVDNLPAVQTVNGTVNVANLPFSDDGSLRVLPSPARQPVLLELLNTPLVIGTLQMVAAPVTANTAGYSSVGVLVTVGANYNYAVPNLQWRWGDDEIFSKVLDKRNGSYGAPGVNGACDVPANIRTLCNVGGAELQVSVMNNFNADLTVQSIRIYLFP